jgi:hypothetical protein
MFLKSICVAGFVGFAAMFAAGCDAGKTSGPEAVAAPANPSYAVTSATVTVSYGIAGYANLGPNQPPLYLAAAKMSDGSVRGFAYSPGGLAGKAVELVRPTPRIELLVRECGSNKQSITCWL